MNYEATFFLTILASGFEICCYVFELIMVFMYICIYLSLSYHDVIFFWLCKDEYKLCHDAVADYLLNDCVYGNC